MPVDDAFETNMRLIEYCETKALSQILKNL